VAAGRATLSLALTALALAVPAGSAWAQAASAKQDFAVSGNTPAVCTLQRGRIQAGGLVNIAGLDGDTLRIENLADRQTLATRAASATISFAAMCNFPHQVRIESQNNGLWPTDARQAIAVPGFATAVPYRASLAWGAVNGTLDAQANVRRQATSLTTVADPVVGDVLVRIEIAQGASNTQVNAPLVAGTYDDTVRIFLEPR